MHPRVPLADELTDATYRFMCDRIADMPDEEMRARAGDLLTRSRVGMDGDGVVHVEARLEGGWWTLARIPSELLMFPDDPETVDGPD